MVLWMLIVAMAHLVALVEVNQWIYHALIVMVLVLFQIKAKRKKEDITNLCSCMVTNVTLEPAPKDKDI